MSGARPPESVEIVATLGPATDAPGLIAALAAAGATLFRINLAHARPDWLAAVLAEVRRRKPPAGALPVVADLPGSKPRTGNLPAPLELRAGDPVWLGAAAADDAAARWIPLNVAEMDYRPRRDDRLLLRDGRIRLAVVEPGPGGCRCIVEAGGEATGRMGVALAGDAGARMRRPLPRGAVERCLAGGVRNFLISYCEEEADIHAVAALCRELGAAEVRLIPKIETRRAMDNLSAIVAASSTCCLARGDLGTQIPLAELPGAERRVLAAARSLGRRAWVAGEVLGGFARAGAASRGELSGVWSALEGGAGGFILSDETAVGPDPAGAVRLLRSLVEAWSPETAT